MEDIGMLPNATYAFANGVSGDGSAITGESGTGGPFVHAFRWTSTGGMQDLGTLPGERTFSTGYAASHDGSAIVGGSGSLSDPRAFLWTPDLGMVDLNIILPLQGVDLSGWRLWEATGISSDGRSLTGNGSFNGEARAWLVTGIPSPGAATGCLIGGVVSLRRRRRVTSS